MTAMTNRYIVVPGSQIGHDCCFTHSVLDTDNPALDDDGLLPEIPVYECVCECYNLESAELIAYALNEIEGTSTIIYIAEGPDDAPLPDYVFEYGGNQ